MATYRLRVVDKSESGGVVKLQCADDDQSVWTSTAGGATGSGGSGGGGTPPLQTLGNTRLEVLDVPILRTADDVPGVYIAAGSPGVSWPGCVVYRSIDGEVTWNTVTTITKAATMGVTTSVLPDWLGGNTIDTCSTVDVEVHGGTLASISEAEFQAGELNVAVIGDEIMRFRYAELLSAGKYRLNHFMRGRKGTEQHQPTHQRGERFVLMTAAVVRVGSDPAMVGRLSTYRGVTLGLALATGLDREVYEEQAGLKPLSPAFLSVNPQSGGYAVNWLRRTRLPAPWADNADAPVGEPAEQYRVRCYWGDIEHSSQIVTTNTATITDASSLLYYSVEVCQLSDRVGAGYPAMVTITS